MPILSGESAEQQWGTKNRKPPEADIDVTPLVDCVFLLLAFFMMTSPMKGNPDRNLPTAQHGGPINPNSATTVSITEAEPNPRIYLDDRESTRRRHSSLRRGGSAKGALDGCDQGRPEDPLRAGAKSRERRSRRSKGSGFASVCWTRNCSN